MIMIDCDNENGFCVNKDGRYRCRCNDGFEEGNDDGTVCNDIDECADPNACAANADCSNTPGAWVGNHYRSEKIF